MRSKVCSKLDDLGGGGVDTARKTLLPGGQYLVFSLIDSIYSTQEGEGLDAAE